VNGELVQLKNAMAEVQYNKEEFNRLEGEYKELQGKYGEELDAKHKIEKEKFAAEHKLKDLTDEVERSKTTEL
jgi:predicted nuclease with TOPRIM domain